MMHDVQRLLKAPVENVNDFCSKLQQTLWVEEFQYEVDVRQVGDAVHERPN